MKKLMILLLSLTVLLVSVSSCTARVSIQPRSTEQVIERETEFINLVEVTPTIVMDKNTGVLYVREKQSTYSCFSIYTTFPIMEADGTCLTYKEAQARERK